LIGIDGIGRVDEIDGICRVDGIDEVVCCERGINGLKRED
jgi:hypothetical protein